MTLKKTVISFFLSLCACCALFADPPTVICFPRDIGVNLEKAKYQRSDTDDLLGFFFDSDGNMYTSVMEPSYSFRMYTPNLSSYLLLTKKNSYMEMPNTGLKCFADGIMHGFRIWIRNETGYDYLYIDNEKEAERYLYSIRNTVIYYYKDETATSTTYKYVGYIFNKDGTHKRLEGNAFFDYAKKSLPELSEKNGMIVFRGHALEGSSNIIDDDGNRYSARVMIPGQGSELILTSAFDTKQNIVYTDTFDQEGNLWYMVFEKGKEDQPKLLYAGRDWGYRQSPKKALCTSDNLRIRLRATTDGYVLGKLMNGQAVRILKTGESATIDGKSAPWYRIKTGDGLVGWAWGGYIRVLDK